MKNSDRLKKVCKEGLQTLGRLGNDIYNTYHREIMGLRNEALRKDSKPKDLRAQIEGVLNKCRAAQRNQSTKPQKA